MIVTIVLSILLVTNNHIFCSLKTETKRKTKLSSQKQHQQLLINKQTTNKQTNKTKQNNSKTTTKK